MPNSYSVGSWTQGFVYGRQALYQLNDIPSSGKGFYIRLSIVVCYLNRQHRELLDICQK